MDHQNGESKHRRTKRTRVRRERILDALQKGVPRHTAATVAGIDRTTFWRWLADDASLRSDVEQAEAAGELALLENINEAAKVDWRAAAWWLERRRPEDYGRHDRLAVEMHRMAAMVADELGVETEEVIREAELVVERYRQHEYGG